MKRPPLFSVLVVLLCLAGQAPDFRDRLAGQLAEAYLSNTPARLTEKLSLEQAFAIQEKFVERIAETYGRVVGYKAGLTSPQARERFGIAHPIKGVLLQGMLLENGAVIPRDFGIRPFIEGDLIARVVDPERLARAATLLEALQGIDAVVPFIELADLVYDRSVDLNAALLVAINVGARNGVLGRPIPVVASEVWLRRLESFRLELSDDRGVLLAAGNGRDLMGHPLNAARWIAAALRAEGQSLRKGDLLSLGSVTPLIPVEKPVTVRARYTGLDPDGPVEVGMRFVE